MHSSIILWIYIGLLLAGGLFGFFKAGSKISLITSAVAAALLIVSQMSGVFTPTFRRNMADGILAALLVVFAIRLTKTKKFMPSGMLLVLTAVTLFLWHVFRF